MLKVKCPKCGYEFEVPAEEAVKEEAVEVVPSATEEEAAPTEPAAEKEPTEETTQ